MKALAMKNFEKKLSTFNYQLSTCSGGYDYFGARYYDSDLGCSLSVDPLMDKYPGWSGYNYVMGNPLNSFDPDGKEVRLDNGARFYDYEPGRWISVE
ncbi:MAG: hypothetical protein HRU80_08245 [Ignavibacteriales bacterium]|nr:MAG: hypothetical protein HRU80_08245 [Ignavibacteriales bacterium]